MGTSSYLPSCSPDTCLGARLLRIQAFQPGVLHRHAEFPLFPQCVADPADGRPWDLDTDDGDEPELAETPPAARDLGIARIVGTELRAVAEKRPRRSPHGSFPDAAYKLFGCFYLGRCSCGQSVV